MDTNKNLIKKIPKEVSHVTSTLEEAGFEAYLVGGCVRDLLMDKQPNDWDITTNAKPEDIVGLFEKTVYENTFGTVGVCVLLDSSVPCSFAHPSSYGATEDRRETDKNPIKRDVTRETPKDDVPRETLKPSAESLAPMIIEVTPYRIEAKYSDFRHPDKVKFSEKLEDDLKRRDFTINAMAYRTSSAKGGSASGGKGPADAKALAGRYLEGDKGHAKGPAQSLKDIESGRHLVDLFDGIKDIDSKVLRTVGEPDDRFKEDALRMLRAVRFSCQLDFSVSHETSESISKNAGLIKKISGERVRDEFRKIIMSTSPSAGIMMLHKFGLLQNIIPELEEGVRCEQSGAHLYDVWEHLLHALQHAANKNWPLEIRLAALFHDIGKPRSRRLSSSPNALAQEYPASQRHRSQEHMGSADNTLLKKVGGRRKYTFYGHEVVGARMTKKIMERLKFPQQETELVEKLVRYHMFFSDTELITLSAVRRVIMKVGKENIWTLMNVRECDRVGMKKKEAPYRLRKYFAMIEEALRDPISVGQLKIDGKFMMKELGIKPGPRMGWMLHALLEEVLDAPEKNTIEHLSELVKSLDMLGDSELKALGERGKGKKEELEEGEIEKLHSKHGVKLGKGSDRKAGA